jgi:hypothetical protein
MDRLNVSGLDEEVRTRPSTPPTSNSQLTTINWAPSHQNGSNIGMMINRTPKATRKIASVQDKIEWLPAMADAAGKMPFFSGGLWY